jgi:hypothetical protein
MTPQHRELFRRQQAPPFLIGLRHRELLFTHHHASENLKSLDFVPKRHPHTWRPVF